MVDLAEKKKVISSAPSTDKRSEVFEPKPSLSGNLPQNGNGVKDQFSLSDSNGKQLSKEQQEYFSLSSNGITRKKYGDKYYEYLGHTINCKSTVASYKDKRKIIRPESYNFICSRHRKHLGEEVCTAHRVREVVLDEIILAEQQIDIYFRCIGNVSPEAIKQAG